MIWKRFFFISQKCDIIATLSRAIEQTQKRADIINVVYKIYRVNSALTCYVCALYMLYRLYEYGIYQNCIKKI